MMKHIFSKAVAAALAASVALAVAVPAFAQPGSRDKDLDGAPPLFSGQEYRGDRDRDGDWGRDNDWRRRKPDFQQVQKDCSIAGIRKAWERNYYSAQYHDGPRLVEGRNGWEMRGKMRLHDRKGYSYVDTYCEVGRGNNVKIEFGRR
jgi:hypothetical protein